jgi:hypothetical protein
LLLGGGEGAHGLVRNNIIPTSTWLHFQFSQLRFRAQSAVNIKSAFDKKSVILSEGEQEIPFSLNAHTEPESKDLAQITV